MRLRGPRSYISAMAWLLIMGSTDSELCRDLRSITQRICSGFDAQFRSRRSASFPPATSDEHLYRAPPAPSLLLVAYTHHSPRVVVRVRFCIFIMCAYAWHRAIGSFIILRSKRSTVRTLFNG